MTSSSPSCCCIPGCSNRHIQWTTPLPRDELLQARWSDAIRAGTGGLSPVEARVCNAHFVDKGAAPVQGGYGLSPGAMEYQEPTLFYRNNVPLQVTWCRLCLSHGTIDSMFNANGHSSIIEQSLSWIANKHFGVWLNPQLPSEVQYFCEKCKLRLEATHSFWQEIQQSTKKYQLLQEKMSFQKLPLNPSEPVMSQPTEMYSAFDRSPQRSFAFVGLPVESPPIKKQNLGKTFAVVEFISKTPAVKVLAVPTAWLQNDMLMWPRLLDGDAIYAMRKEGTALPDGVETDSFPVVVLQQFEEYHSAEAAVQDVLRRRNPEPCDSMSVPEDILTLTTFRTEIHQLKTDLNSLVQTAVEAAVERSVRSNVNRFPMGFGRGRGRTGPFSSTGAHYNTGPISASDVVLTVHAEVEKHKKIVTEEELDAFNTRLADPAVCQKYLDYFAKIIHPKNSSNGDNALYTIVDYLFTRDFWNNFTWTGINRGQKSSRGFREFANVTDLLLQIVLLGDASYDASRLEQFCRAKLFRHSKSRSISQRLRKSACRPSRKRALEQARRTLEDSRSSDAGGEMEAPLEDAETGTGSGMVCKVEVGSEDMWRQPDDSNTGQYSDGMM